MTTEDEAFAAAVAAIQSSPILQIDVLSPRGVPVTLCHRNDTSDLSVIGSTFNLWGRLEDEYRLADLRLDGRFVDVGAHIGSVTIAVLLDNPNATAVLVEPIPENVEMIRLNLAAAGVADRATIIEGAVGTDAISYNHSGSPVASTNRYIGNLNIDATSDRIEVRRIKLADLLPAAAMKLDCEGGEWALFKQRGITKVPLVFGEYHGNPGAEGVLRAFGKTHDVEFSAVAEPTGGFRAVAK